MDENQHPLHPQLVQCINHYGLDQVLAALATATLEVADAMETAGADAPTVGQHRSIAGIMAQAAQL